VLHSDLYAGALPTLTAEQAIGAELTLLDARAPERFRGDVEPIDPVAGHIPGAVNVPTQSVLDDEGQFVSEVPELAGEVGAYCGSGVTASVVIAALAAAGVD